MRRWLVGASVMLGVVVGVAGCTSSGSGSNSAGRAAGVAPEPAGIRSSAATTAGGAGSAADLKAALLEDGSKIRTAVMTVDVRRGGVAAAADRAETIAEGTGGEVDSDDRASGPHATADLQLRVPPAALGDVLSRLSRLGHEVSRQLSTTDVTQRVADVDSRVRSAQASIARLRILYANAAKVADVIAIESELNDREADLESLQAQQRTLQQQTALATVTLSLRTAAGARPAPVKHHSRGGFVGGLQRGWDGFGAAAGWVATAVGTLLPFLGLLALLAAAGRFAWTRRPRRVQPAPSE